MVFSADIFSLFLCVALFHQTSSVFQGSPLSHQGRKFTITSSNSPPVNISFGRVDQSRVNQNDGSASMGITVFFETAVEVGTRLHCSAYDLIDGVASQPDSVYDVVRTGSSVLVDPDDFATSLTVTGLYAATEYTVYCVTESPSGTLNSLQSALRTALPIETACCKIMNIDVLKLSVPEQLYASDMVKVTLSSPPRYETKISLKALPLNSSSFVGSSGYFYPAMATVLPTQKGSIEYTFSYVAGDVGYQVVNVTLDGSGNKEYLQVYTYGNSFYTAYRTQVPNTPLLLTAKFASDGTYVILTFDSATNQAGYANIFTCSALLSFSGNSTSICQWVSSTVIWITPLTSETSQSESLVVENSEITLLPSNQVRAECYTGNFTECALWPSANETTVRVQYPVTPLKPTVAISAPSELGGCGSYLLDISNSKGSAGRDWHTVNITVSDQDPAFPATALQNFFWYNYTLSPPSIAPNSVITRGRTYIIDVTLCNFLRACNSLTTTFTVADNTNIYPNVAILGDSYRTITRKTALSLTGTASTQTCTGETSTSGLSYAWQVYQVGNPDLLLSMPSTSQNVAMYKQPAYALNLKVTYRIVLTVTFDGNQASATSYVYVEPSAVVAVISGNQEVAWKVNSYNLLSASESYDLDLKDVYGTAAGLTFSWSCVQTIPILPTCGIVMVPTADPSKLNVTSTYSAVNTTNRVYVTVTDGSRVSTTSVLINIIQTAQSQLAVTTMLGLGVPVNTDTSLRLKGSLELVQPCTAVWNAADGTSLASQALTATSKSFQVGKWTYELLLKANVLPQRSTVAFKLSCGGRSSSISLTTNGSPLPGSLQISPLVGEELSTLFTLVASKWTDVDIPITYQFGFISSSSLADLVIISSSELSYGSTVLPAGPTFSAHRVNCTLAVSDVYQATAQTRKEVTVNTVTIEQQSSSITSLLQGSSGSVDDTKKVIATAGSLLNNVNCSITVPCDDLNRDACLKTSYTCSACKTGYIGDVGDKNTPCVEKSKAGQNTYGSSCIQGSNDCGTDWYVCNASNLCDFTQKNCPNDCSGANGECYFLDINTGSTVEECSVMSSTCESLCRCFNEYTGIACEISIVDLKQKQILRRALIDSLSNVTVIDDISATSIVSWSTFLSVVSQNPFEISAVDSSSAQELALKIVNNAKDESFKNIDDLIGVLQSMNAMFSVAESNYNPSDLNSGTVTKFNNFTAGNILRIVGAYANMVGQDMVLGQNSTEYIYENFRMSSSANAVPAGGSSDINISTPLNTIEESQGTTGGSWVSITASGASGSANEETLKVSLIVTKGKSYAFNVDDLLSNPVTLDISQSLNSVDVSSVTFQLPSIKSVPQRNYTNTTFDFECRTETDTFVYTCPGSGAATFECVDKELGTHTMYCPIFISTVACASLNASNGEMNTNLACTTEIVDDVTTCTCPLPSRRRRSLALGETADAVFDETGVTNMVASTVDIGVSFSETFKASDELFSEKGIQKAYIILVLFVTLWGGGAIIFFLLMFKEQKLKKDVVPAADVAAPVAIGKPRPTGTAQLEFVNIYMKRLFPKVYGHGLLWQRVFEEVFAHQRYLQFFNVDKAVNYQRRASLFAQLMTLQGMLIFLLAVLYDVQAPTDDGTCNQFDNEKSCTREKTVLDYSQDKCRWEDDENGGGCYYRQAQFNMTVLFYSLIISVMFTALAEVPIGWLFVMINAPREGEHRAGAATDASERVRRSSVVARSAAGSGAVKSVPEASSSQRGSFLTRSTSQKGMLATPREIPSSVLTAQSDVESLRVRMQQTLDAKRTTRESILMESGPITMDEFDSIVPMHPALSTRKTAPSTPRSPHADTSFDHQHGAEKAAPIMKKLMRELLLQREKLDGEELDLFDDMWKVYHGTNGEMPSVATVQSAQRNAVLPIDSETYRAIGRDLIFSEARADELCRQMEHFNKQQVGLAIMMHFFLDMLGRDTPQAKVFKNKLDEDFEVVASVPLTHKIGAASIIAIVNIFFVIFCMLKGVQQGLRWQRSFCFAALLQLALEILLFATLETIWLDFFLPSLISPQIARLQRELTASFSQTFAKDSQNYLDADATPYLFISSKMAKRYPDLVESIFVHSYQTYLPWGLASRWPTSDAVNTGSRSKRLQNNETWYSLVCASFSLSAITLFVLSMFGAIPYDAQRTLMKLIAPAVFSAAVLVVVSVKDSSSSMIVFLICGIGLLIAFGRQFAREHLNRRTGERENWLHLILPETFNVTASDLETTAASNSEQITRTSDISRVVPQTATATVRTDDNSESEDEFEEVEEYDEVEIEVDASDSGDDAKDSVDDESGSSVGSYEVSEE